MIAGFKGTAVAANAGEIFDKVDSAKSGKVTEQQFADVMSTDLYAPLPGWLLHPPSP